MSNQFASGKHSIAECDMCGFRFKLAKLKKLIVKGKIISTKVCPQCWVPDQPQLRLGERPVVDPQAVRDPRPDLSRYSASGSRNIQWGWNPVGGARSNASALTPNDLVITCEVGSVTIG